MPILEDSTGNVYVIQDDTSQMRPDSLPSLNGDVGFSQTVVEIPYGYEITPGDDEQLVGVSVMSLDPVSSSDASGLTAVMLDLLGAGKLVFRFFIWEGLFEGKLPIFFSSFSTNTPTW